MTNEQVKHMVSRFLSWRLPDDFRPDCGIAFDAEAAIKKDPRNVRYEPVGTNLLTAAQAEAMVRHLVADLPPLPVWGVVAEVAGGTDRWVGGCDTEAEAEALAAELEGGVTGFYVIGPRP